MLLKTKSKIQKTQETKLLIKISKSETILWLNYEYSFFL